MSTLVDSRPSKPTADQDTPAPTVEPARRIPPVWVHALLLLALAALTAAVSLGLWGWTYDDAFIIYRYAHNFANGLGMVYNPGEHYLGTSSAGYTLLLALLSRLLPWFDFPVLGSIVSALGIWSSGALVWAIGVRSRTLLAGALAALITVVNPVLVESWGGEMQLLVPLILGAILAYSLDKYTLAGLLLGLAVLTRQDSLVLVALMGAHYLWVKRSFPLKPGIVFVLVLLPWFVYAWLFFGSPLPGTLEAKVAEAKAGWPYFFSGTVQWLSDRVGYDPLVRPLVFALIVLGGLTLCLQWLRNHRAAQPWLLLVGWAALFTGGYVALRVAFFGWYDVPISVACGVLLAWGLAGVSQFAGTLVSKLSVECEAPGAGPSRLARANRLMIIVPVLVLLALPVSGRLRSFATDFIRDHRLSDLYLRAGNWLVDHGGPNASVAYLEVGEVGFYSQSRVIDLLGLVTPGATTHVPSRDFEWAIEYYKPEYYLASSRFETLLGNFASAPWFTEAYEQVATLDDPWRTGQHYQMTVFKLKPNATLPQPVRPVAVQPTNQHPFWVYTGLISTHWPGQQFTAPEANLSSVSIFTGIPDNLPQGGSLVLHLRESAAGGQDLRRSELPLGTIGRNSWLTFRFDPLPDSAGRSYFVALEVKGLPPGRKGPNVAIWYATDDLYSGGTRYEGNQRVPGDLTFRLGVPDKP